jgi:lariat debranching enzyme
MEFQSLRDYICSAMQAIRNVADLECMAVPRKYLQLGTFHKYYSGAKVVPYPTVFIGGNHEASNYLWEL